jgi:hypothetical protein
VSNVATGLVELGRLSNRELRNHVADKAGRIAKSGRHSVNSELLADIGTDFQFAAVVARDVSLRRAHSVRDLAERTYLTLRRGWITNDTV